MHSILKLLLWMGFCSVLVRPLSIDAAENPGSAGFYHPLTLAPADGAGTGAGEPAPSEGGDVDLAKKLSNPISSLISVPFQNNFDFGGGPNDEGFRYQLNFQPVVPFSMSENWNLIVRTIVPIIYQDQLVNNSSQSGLGDITQSFFFSRKKGRLEGVTFGFGPVFLYPSATDSLLGTGKLGAGPTAVLLKQQDAWTYGILANHIWSVAGAGSREDVNQTFLQPFLALNTKTKTTFSFNTESTYNWESSDWNVPLNLSVSQLVRIGKLPVSFQIGGRYFADKPSGGSDWGIRFVVTLLFPKK